jgi:hypothetical protein
VRYRAVLIVPEGLSQERAVQSYGNSVAELQKWACLKKESLEGAAGVLESAPRGSYVIVYESLERPVAKFTRTADLAGQVIIVEEKVQ